MKVSLGKITLMLSNPDGIGGLNIRGNCGFLLQSTLVGKRLISMVHFYGYLVPKQKRWVVKEKDAGLRRVKESHPYHGYVMDVS